ncbi:hypothetical protein G210_1802 [Candida maltosa Xu316]|uniref:Uncharacterized protein n=1 Tax=Candida maltosa (strain Xu316) TaxID=1245528 RepID=M3IMY0_CANMX|nr:hypothetical protein G210_1802 [Candida maltosa Xu316]
MKFSYFLTCGLFALSTNAAIIQSNEVAVEEVAKRASVDVAGTIAADLLHLIGVALGGDVSINVKRDTVTASLAADILQLLELTGNLTATVDLKRDVTDEQQQQETGLEKRLDLDLVGSLAADIAGLLGISAGGSVDVNVKRDVAETLRKRATVDVAASIAADLLHLIGVAVGADVSLNIKRDTIDLSAAADILNAIDVSALLDADVSLKKRSDLSGFAQNIPAIISGVLTAVDAISNATAGAIY